MVASTTNRKCFELNPVAQLTSHSSFHSILYITAKYLILLPCINSPLQRTHYFLVILVIIRSVKSVSYPQRQKHNSSIRKMEALLSLSFDNLSSYDGPKIRKGLRQVEGLLAQICLSSASAKPVPPQGRPRSMINDPGKEPPARKQLSELKDDPAFREFFKLQEGFEWNVALRLVNCLDRLLGKSNDGQNDLLILACLDLIQGILLLHPPSRSLFSREIYMNVRFLTIRSYLCSDEVLTFVYNSIYLISLSPSTVPPSNLQPS